jgi:hypothetical protein
MQQFLMSSPKVSYSDLEVAFMFASYERQYWLDKQTGEILSFSEDVYEALSDGGDLSDYPDWQQSEIEAARRVLRAFGELPDGEKKDNDASILERGSGEQNYVELDRYVRIEEIDSHKAFEFMSGFDDALTDSHLQQLLFSALRTKHPFRRFKDVLLDFPEERERWFEYESKRRREYIERWSRDENVEIDSEQHS